MFVSIAWGVLFLTDSLTIWKACVLLVLHGMAGALWGPAEQLMLHDFVGTEDLPSAVRLNATFKSLGILFGPVVGSALLLGLGPIYGIFANVLIYLPLTLFLFRTRFTGHLRDDGVPRPRLTLAGCGAHDQERRGQPGDRFHDHSRPGSGRSSSARRCSRRCRSSPRDLGARDVGHGVRRAAVRHRRGRGRRRPAARGDRPDQAHREGRPVSTAIYGLAILGFAITHSYLLAVILLLIGGVANLASMSIGQTVVQLEAPPAERGRVLGVYAMSASGLRAGSGFTVGLLGAAVGLHWSLGLSAAALCVGTALAAVYALRRSGADDGAGSAEHDVGSSHPDDRVDRASDQHDDDQRPEDDHRPVMDLAEFPGLLDGEKHPPKKPLPGNDHVHSREPTEHGPVGPSAAGTVDLEAVRPRVDSIIRSRQDGPTNRTADEPN